MTVRLFCFKTCYPFFLYFNVVIFFTYFPRVFLRFRIWSVFQMTDLPSPPVRRRDRSLAATTGSPANRTSYISSSGSGLKPTAAPFSRAILRSQSQPSPAGGKPVINRSFATRTAGVSARGRSTAVKGSGGTARHEKSAETSSAEESDVSGCQRKIASFIKKKNLWDI